jgi:hypothetical protein
MSTIDHIQHNLLHTAGSSLRTGYVIIDTLIVIILGSLFSLFMSNANAIWISIQMWTTNKVKVKVKTATYKHKFVIRLNELQVSGVDGHRNTMAVNDANSILITGIIRDLMSAGATDDVYKLEVKNLMDDGQGLCSRDRHLASVISSFPQSDVTWRGMRFEFENKQTVNTESKEPSVSRSEQIVVYSNDRLKTIAYFESCKQAEIDRLYPAPKLDLKFQPYYWFIATKPITGDSNYVFNRYPWSSTKTFDSLFFARKTEVLQTLDHFSNHTGPWAPEKQRTHTCNIFLSGRPGGGKTSMVKAIANYMDRHIFGINMSRVKNDEDMIDIASRLLVEYRDGGCYTSYENVPLSRRIYLLEDLDCAGCEHIIAPRNTNWANKAVAPQREETPQTESEEDDDGRSVQGSAEKDKAFINKFSLNDTSLSGFLNMLNGINELTGAMFIISTNHKERFDPAIYRPGRMDIDNEMGCMSADDIRGYMRRYYGEVPDDEESRAAIDAADGVHMPSRIEQICQMNASAKVAVASLAE